MQTRDGHRSGGVGRPAIGDVGHMMGGSPAMPNGRCRLHGGMSPGAPKGNMNAFKHGRYTAEAIANRARLRRCCGR